jgi:hypothetical protein
VEQDAEPLRLFQQQQKGREAELELLQQQGQTVARPVSAAVAIAR